MKMSDVLTTVNGKPISVQDVVDHLKVSGVFRSSIYKLIENEVVNAKARELGVVVTEEETDAHCDHRRRMMGLSGSQEISQFCRMHGVRWEHWKTASTLELLRQKVKGALITDSVIKEFFQQHQDALKMVCLSRIVCKDRETAEQVLATLQRGEADFSTLARRHSEEHHTRIAGGYVGCFKRGMLPGEVEPELFKAGLKQVIGPLSHAGSWSLYQVQEIFQAELNAATRSHIADKLFAEWLRRAVFTVKA